MGIARRLSSQSSSVAQAFQFTIQVASGGSFTLPLTDYNGLTPNFVVTWGDGSSNTITSSSDVNTLHTYASAGTYQISITGFMPGFIVNNTTAIKSLIKSVNAWGTVGLRQINFYGCTFVTSLPSDYIGLQDVEVFSSFMRQTGITSIPSGIFQYATNASNFSDVFSYTNITSIPSGLFDTNVNASIFASSFNNCLLLASYPATLFDNCVNAINFSATFRLCKLLTFSLQFTYNTQVTIFSNIYYMNSTSNSMSGTAPTLWLRSPQPYGAGAFHNCTGLSNYASIPTNFK